MFRANRSSCKGYRVRNSGSLRLDRIGRTSPDCKLRAAPRPEWPARITKRQQGLSVSSWMNLLNASLVSIVEVLTKFRFCDAAHDREDSADLMNLARHDLGFSKTMDRFPKGKRSGRCARARQSVLAAMTKPQAELKKGHLCQLGADCGPVWISARYACRGYARKQTSRQLSSATFSLPPCRPPILPADPPQMTAERSRRLKNEKCKEGKFHRPLPSCPFPMHKRG
jgi:hypothetical protein